MKYLKLSNSINEYIDWLDEIRNNYWQIRDEYIEDRKNSIENTKYYNELYKLAKISKINFDETEIISWLDSMTIIYETLRRLSYIKKYETIKERDYVYHLKYKFGRVYEINKNEYKIRFYTMDKLTIINNVNELYKYDENQDKYFDEIKIIQELHIPFTNKRADFVLFKDNKILIIEFSFDRWKNNEYHYNTKLNQVIGYKECLENILPKHIEIATYTFIIKPEDKDYTAFPNNNENIENLKNFIINFFSNTKKDALTELSKIQIEQ